MKFEIRRLDVYRKIPQDLTEATLTGAIISLTCIVLIIFLFIVELKDYLTPEISSKLYVESGGFEDNERIPVTLNISVAEVACDVIGLDIQDLNGRHEVGFVENTDKIPINNGRGCRMETNFYINKVPGNFHVSTHSAKHQPDKIDMAHVIHVLRFGEYEPGITGGFESLNSKDNSQPKEDESHEYVLKVVPSIYEDRYMNRKYLYQYTYGYHSYIPMTFGRPIPAIWFKYDLNPITIKYTAHGKNFYAFITLIFALIGGTFTVAGIINSLIFTMSNVFRKFELGKLS